MRTVPPRRRGRIIRSTIWLALALTAAVLAIAWALFTLGSSASGAIASAELTSGAALQANTGWLLPAVFSVLVFAGVVLAAQRIAKKFSSSSLPTPSTAEHAGPPPRPGPARAPIPFELRSPDRAVSEAGGMLRPHD